ncbi:MAG: SPOR domain-containing protein [Bacteroidales bacterium]|nr:SPOR domain-containing protein [Bacteroidales bacterium]
MIDLSKYICELLHSHECVVVPELGGFITRKKNAVVYVAQNLFAPPSKHLHFNAQLTHNDGLLAHHISKENGISYEKALEEIHETVSDILYQLYKGGSVVFVQIGVISNQNGFMKFEPSAEQNIQDESYGLNSFIMPMLQHDGRRSRPIVARRERKKTPRKFVKSYQVAAVMAFLLLGIGGYFLQTDPVQDYVRSSFCPHVSHIVNDFFADTSPLPSPTSTAIDNFMAFAEPQPVVVSEAAEVVEVVAAEEEAIEPVVSTEVVENSLMQTPVHGQYYIIIGAFQQHALADKLCKQMKADGYGTAAVLDIPDSRYRRVALQSFDNLASAQASLREVKKVQEDAWVLKWKN